eukprot:750516-Hanusia_phi.AAC.1
MRQAKWGLEGKDREWKEKLCKVCVDSLHCDATSLHGRCLQCTRSAVFGQPASMRSKPLSLRSPPTHCKLHRLEGEVDVVHAVCEVVGCNKQSVYGEDGESPMRCSQHKEQGDTSFGKKTCKQPGCPRTPSFGDPKDRKAVCCAKHRAPGHVALRTSKCLFASCSKVPSYGKEGGKPVFCASHRGPEHVDLKNKRCTFVSDSGEKCTTQATLAFEHDRKSMFCKKHATEDCVHVRNRRCDHPEGCAKVSVP